MSGLSAARKLAEAGHPVTLLEASARVGGRILTHREGTEIIELGAEFIHGKPPELWSLIDEAKLETYELDGRNLNFEQGTLHKSNQPDEEEDEAAGILNHLESRTGPDISFAEYLDELNPPAHLRHSAIGYVEGFNAADHRIIGVASLAKQQSAENAVEGDRLFRIRGGYDLLPRFLAERITASGGRILLNTRVKHIAWTRKSVRVQALHDGKPVAHEATRAIIALPLGVLQQNAVSFTPVPSSLREGHRLRVGQVRRFTLLFREKFWAKHAPDQPGHVETPGDFSFLFAFESIRQSGGLLSPLQATPSRAGSEALALLNSPTSRPSNWASAHAILSAPSFPVPPMKSAVNSCDASPTTGSTIPFSTEPTAISPPDRSTPAQT